MNFRNYRPRKTWVDKWLKSPVWDDPSTSNTAKRPKHRFNLNGSTFTIFIDHCEGSRLGKSHSQWYAKSQDFSLTHWLPMISILFLVETIQCKQLRCICRKNKKFFLNFFVHFSNLHQILNIFKERWPSEFMYFRNYGPRKTWSGKCLKSPVLDHRSTGNMVNGPKHWFNLNGSSLTIFIDQYEGNWVGKSDS